MKKKLLAFVMAIAAISMVNAQCPANAGPDNEACGIRDTLHAITANIGISYWSVASMPNGEENCCSVFSCPLTGTPDIYNPNAVITVCCYGEWQFIWHEINGNCEEKDTVTINFSQTPIQLPSLPEEKNCLNHTQPNIDTTGYSNEYWYWNIKPDWPYYSQVDITFNHYSILPTFYRNFPETVFGDSGHVVIPLKLIISTDSCTYFEYREITFYQQPDENIFAVDTIISGSEVTLNLAPSSPVNNGFWSYADGSYLPYPNDQFSYTFSFNDYGNYGVAFNESNPLGDGHSSCSVSDTVVIRYDASNPVNFSFLVDTSQLNLPFSLNSSSISNISESSGSFSWSIYEGNAVNSQNLLYQSNTDTPDYEFESTGTFLIELVIENNKSANSMAKYAVIHIKEIDENVNEISFDQKLFPNPSTGKIYIDIEHFEKAEIFDINGKLVFNSKQKKLDLSHKAKGVYYVKVTSSNAVTTHKLVLE